MPSIQAKKENLRVDYGEVQLPALFLKQDSDSKFSQLLPMVTSEGLCRLVNGARLTLLIACDSIQHPEIIRALIKQADQNIRIYLLLGEKDANTEVIQALSARCFIRTGVAQQGALVLVDHSTFQADGVLISDHRVLNGVDRKSYNIKLDGQQVEDSFRSFCKLFWEDSQAEILMQNQSNPAVPHPNGDIVTNNSHQLCGMLAESLKDTWSSVTAVSNFLPEQIDLEAPAAKMLLGTSTDTDMLKRKAGPGVALSDAALPSLLFSKDAGWLLPCSTDGSKANWCIRLSRDQAARMEPCLDNAISEAAWQYQSGTSLGSLQALQTLRYVDKPDKIETVQESATEDLGDISVPSIDDFLQSAPEKLLEASIQWQPERPALAVDYLATIHPPYYPGSAVPDAIYEQWQKAEDDWAKRIGHLKDLQRKIDNHQQQVNGSMRDLLKHFLLGQTQASKSIDQNLDELERWHVTEASPAEREEFRSRYKELVNGICMRENETTIEIDKAKKHQLWIEKQQQISRSISHHQQVLESARQQHNTLESAKALKKDSLESEFRLGWRAAIETLSEKQAAEIYSKNARLMEASGNKGDNKKSILLAMDAETAMACRNKIKEKHFRKHYPQLNKALEELKLGSDKVDRDLSEALHNIESAEAKLVQLETSLSDHGTSFEYRPDKSAQAFEQQLGLNRKSGTNAEFTWPELELPAKGTELKVTNNKRWLVITNTEQLVQARVDAARFSAVICVSQPA